MGKEMESVVTKGTGVDVTDQESENVREILGVNILYYRQKLKMTRAELAEKIGLSEAAIGQYERATRTPTIEYICKLSNVFGVPVDLLVGHGNSEYDSVMEYRFDKAAVFIRRLSLFIFETSDKNIKICRRKDGVPSFQLIDGVLFQADKQDEFDTLIKFNNRQTFITFTEYFMGIALNYDAIPEMFCDYIFEVERNRPFEPILDIKYGGNQPVVPF